MWYLVKIMYFYTIYSCVNINFRRKYKWLLIKKETAEVKKGGKSEAIEAITDQINKKYGQGSFMRIGSNKTVNVGIISTGALTFDHDLGVGGSPRGRIY